VVSVIVVDIEEVDCSWFMSSTPTSTLEPFLN